jgi:hypothetical protein
VAHILHCARDAVVRFLLRAIGACPPTPSWHRRNCTYDAAIRTPPVDPTFDASPSPLALPKAACSPRAEPPVHDPCAPVRSYSGSPRQTAAFAISEVYRHLVAHSFWSADCTESPYDVAARGRRLCTNVLDRPDADAHNGVAGAIALADAWIELDGDDATETDAGGVRRLTLDTRMRLAVCLATSWNFQRHGHSRFHAEFLRVQDGATRLHTHELAFVGCCFMHTPESVQFGPFCAANTRRIATLYDRLLEFQVDLLASIRVFPLLTANLQCVAEDQLEKQHARGWLGEHELLTARSVVPFFVRIWLKTRPLSATPEDAEEAGGVACAACVVLLPSAAHNFSTPDKRLARAAIHTALGANQANRDLFWRGNFASRDWASAQLVTCASLKRALLYL